MRTYALTAAIDNSVVEARRYIWTSFGLKLISPLYISLLNTLIAIGAAFVPPDIINLFLAEHDYVFLSVPYLIVVISSEFAFCMGMWCYALIKCRTNLAIRRTPKINPTKKLCLQSAFIIIMVILLEAVIISVIVTLIGPEKLAASFSDPNIANVTRLKLISTTRIHGINILAFQFGAEAALLASFYIFMNIRTLRIRRALLALYSFASILYLAASFLTFSRWPIMAFIVSLVALLLLKRNSESGTGIRTLSYLSFPFLGTLLITFLTFSFIKIGSSHLLNSIIGYTLGSYNLGAAAITNAFTQPYSDTSYGTLGMFWNAPVIGPHLRDLAISLGLGLPRTSVIEMGQTVQLWTNAAAQSGLNITYLWDSVFGYIYSDVGFAYPFVFFVYGFVSWFLYEGFMRLSLLRMLLYIVFLVSLITWFTSAFISNTPLDDFAFFSILITVYLRKQWRLSIWGP